MGRTAIYFLLFIFCISIKSSAVSYMVKQAKSVFGGKMYLVKHYKENTFNKDNPRRNSRLAEERNEDKTNDDTEIEELLQNIEAEDKEYSDENIGHMILRMPSNNKLWSWWRIFRCPNCDGNKYMMAECKCRPNKKTSCVCRNGKQRNGLNKSKNKNRKGKY